MRVINEFTKKVKTAYRDVYGKMQARYLRFKDYTSALDKKIKSIKGLKILYSIFKPLLIFVYGVLECAIKVVYSLSIWVISMVYSLVVGFICIPEKIYNYFKGLPERFRKREKFIPYMKRQGHEWKRSFKKDWLLYLLFLPVLVYIVLFLYMPKVGLIIAFKDYSVFKGMWDSPWTSMNGFYHFFNFFNNPYFGKLIYNTIMINVYGLVFIFPLPIILAIMLNEVRKKWFKETVQTIVFLPYFISTIVVVSIFLNFISYDGIINDVLNSIFGMDRKHFILDPTSALLTYYSMGIYTNTGYSALLYIAALTAIDPSLYEAGKMDGATKIQEIKYITIPSIMPTIIIMLILRIGKLLNVGYETLILMYQPVTYDKLDVISTYVYRLGIVGKQYSYTAAVGIFNAVISLVLVYTANKLARKTGNSLW